MKESPPSEQRLPHLYITLPFSSCFTTSSTRGRLLPNPRKLISSSSTAECFRLPFAGEVAREEGGAGLPEEPVAPAAAAAAAAAEAATVGTKQQKQQPERPLSTSTAKLMKGLPRRLRMGEEEEKLRRHLRVACASERACAREKGEAVVGKGHAL